MSLHPQVKSLLEFMDSRGLPPIEELPLTEARASFDVMSQKLNQSETIARVENKTIPGYKNEIQVRIYTPVENRVLPVLVYYHGGGWVIGSLDSYDALCRSLANKAECIVVSVDYSLAPEEKFPVAVEDAYLALEWVYKNAEELQIDRTSLAVGGDSAGGNLAAVVSYLTYLRKGPHVACQMLFYPSVGFDRTESYEKFGEGYYLTKATMNWFTEQYLNSPEDMMDPLAAPLLIPDEEVVELPPAYILTAEYDPLRDGGEAYAKKLSAAGVKTEYVRYPGMIHGFLSMTEAIEDGQKAIIDAAKALKQKLSERAANRQRV
ncbi:alpha/beta hydrolase [Pseudalkalibacillus caeni]|uniref:Alpha/beta hydrolase n=1 Tax=Exobacillus caeni TaxID=2574798 RepID=A0A5R9F1L0_9BACL|nr:alpha/beta hydrolase [Pseudalkalibacillus caeni]TLS36911.1 alpha/beta hydrolase [Pseudalkalibacillus caeni]